jgi:hypothetical protein
MSGFAFSMDGETPRRSNPEFHNILAASIVTGISAANNRAKLASFRTYAPGCPASNLRLRCELALFVPHCTAPVPLAAFHPALPGIGFVLLWACVCITNHKSFCPQDLPCLTLRVELALFRTIPPGGSRAPHFAGARPDLSLGQIGFVWRNVPRRPPAGPVSPFGIGFVCTTPTASVPRALSHPAAPGIGFVSHG